MGHSQELDSAQSIHNSRFDFFRCRRFWLTSVPLVALFLTAFFRLANPQWHKSIYIFQVYVWPWAECSRLGPPLDYTGRWITWWPNGYKRTEFNYLRGKLHGKLRRWSESGQVEMMMSYLDGRESGKWTEWHSNGQMSFEIMCSDKRWRRFPEHILDGRARKWNGSGTLIVDGIYKDGLPFHGTFLIGGNLDMVTRPINESGKCKWIIVRYSEGKPIQVINQYRGTYWREPDGKQRSVSGVIKYRYWRKTERDYAMVQLTCKEGKVIKSTVRPQRSISAKVPEQEDNDQLTTPAPEGSAEKNEK